MSQVDFPATLAALTGQTPAEADAPDSFNVLGALLGETRQGRDHLVEHARTLSLLKGPWKYIAPSKGRKMNRATNTELGLDPAPQLYDLDKDLGERRNVASEHPEVVREMAALLERIKAAGRSRPQ